MTNDSKATTKTKVLQIGKQSLLKPGDLVDDRELRRADEDRFEHQRIADQLVELATSVETPTNIALYGPWGSGKTGISNLMQAKVKSCKGVRYARFDASKYAENPLRRTFVSAVANELEISYSKYHRDLYSGRTRTDIRLPAAEVGKLLGVFAGLIVALCAILAGVVAIVALAQTGDFSSNYTALSRAVVTAGLLPAALLAGLITLVNKSLQVDRSLAKPDSDEQFEQLLADLVADSKADRVVIFVDELDRCASDDVVATLDAVRTFLGVHRCVFVIAADQHVLEEALSRNAQQTTPIDVQNPYYSTGSAYLDKVFQYQVSLPDLLPPNITEFAYGLVNDRNAGLWSELGNVAFVISVLVPSHVTSPRRVKHLINTFALAYRLAEDRHTSGHLHEDPTRMAAALAKLTCLRVEFPLFARDLRVDANLPDRVLSIVEKSAPAGDSKDEIALLAKRYAENETAVATIIAVPSEERDGQEEDELRATRQNHNRQLLNYLRRTRTVDGPSRDLIYLQSEESLSGLDESVAKQLVLIAEDGDAAAMIEMFTSESVPVHDREAALRFLVTRMRHSLGVGAENISRTLLLTAEKVPYLPTASIADEALATITAFSQSGAAVLNSTTAAGAWVLAVEAQYDTESIRHALIEMVAEDDDVDFQFVLTVPWAASANVAGVTSLLADGLLSEDRNITLQTLRGLRSDERQQLLQIGEGIASSFADRFKERGEAEKAAEQRAKAAEERVQAAANPAGISTGVEGGEEDDVQLPVDPAPAIEALASLAESWATDDPQSAYAVVGILLDIDNSVSRDAVHSVLSELPTTADARIVTKILNAVMSRAVWNWPSWLNAVAVQQYPSVAADQWERLLKKLWRASTSTGSPKSAQIEEVLSALATLIEPQEIARPQITHDVLDMVSGLVETDSEAVARTSILDCAREFSRYGFVDGDALSLALLVTATETIRSEVHPDDAGNVIVDYVCDVAMESLADQVVRHQMTEEVRALLSALQVNGWVRTPLRTYLLLQLVGVAEDAGVRAEEFRPDAAEMKSLVGEWGSEGNSALVTWLSQVPIALRDGAELLRTIVETASLSDEIANAFAQQVLTWPEEDRLALIEPYIRKANSPMPAKRLLVATGWGIGSPAGKVDMLISRYKASTNNPMRGVVLDLWVAASVRGDTERSLLFREILIPMLELKTRGGGTNVEAVRFALRRLREIGGPPKDVKKAFDSTLEAAIRGHEELEETAVATLTSLGYDFKRSGFLWTKTRIAFDGYGKK